VVSKNSRSTPRWSRLATRPKTSCSSASLTCSSQSIARQLTLSVVPGKPWISTSRLIQLAAASFDDGARARLATSANSTRSAGGSRRRPAGSRRITAPIPSCPHSPSGAQVPPSGRDSVNSSPSAAAACVASGSRNLVTDATSRCRACRFAVSSRPKLQTTWTFDRLAAGSHTLCGSCR
jgi:hypothetical protein